MPSYTGSKSKLIHIPEVCELRNSPGSPSFRGRCCIMLHVEIPPPGVKPTPPAVKGRVLTTEPQGSLGNSETIYYGDCVLKK